MSNYYSNPASNPSYGAASAQNLQFYPSSYSPAQVSGHATPAQASYGYGAPSGGPGGFGASFSGPGAGVSGRMGEQGGLRTGWLAAFSTEGYDGEPDLLSELGIEFSHIRTKATAVLNPFGRIDQHLMDDSDIAGPVLFFALFGFILLLSGKLHFGYIYGLALLGSISLHTILSLMTPSEPSSATDPQYAASGYGDQSHGAAPGVGPRQGHLSSTLTYPRSASVLGYCLLPLVATSLVGIVWPMDGKFGLVLTAGAIVWCTLSSSGMFCAVGRMRGMRLLVAYPLVLFYTGFGLMGIFSSRGSGSLATAAAKLNS